MSNCSQTTFVFIQDKKTQVNCSNFHLHLFISTLLYFCRIFYSDDDVDSDEENSKMSGARKTQITAAPNRNHLPDTRERIAIDISLLKKQYAKLRERQRQANLTNTARQQQQQQQVTPTISNSKPSNINQYLIGRNAIVGKGKRIGPPAGTIPPPRVSLPVSATNKYQQKRLRNATIDNASTSIFKLRGDDNSNVQKKQNTFARGRSESSSYSEDSDKDSEDEFSNRVINDTSSSSTSLCDDEIGNVSSMEASPMKSRLHSSASDDCSLSKGDEFSKPTYFRFNEYQDVDGDIIDTIVKSPIIQKLSQENETNIKYKPLGDVDVENNDISLKESKTKTIEPKTDLNLLTLPNREKITSTSQLSPIADISHILASSTISPLKTPTSYLLNSYPLCEVIEQNQEDSIDVVDGGDSDLFKVSDEGVTNAYFERINREISNSQLNRDGNTTADLDDEMVSSSSSNSNTDRILKMIEENSKILDRIMSKNAQCSGNLIDFKENDDVAPAKSDIECDSQETPEANLAKKGSISNIPDDEQNELNESVKNVEKVEKAEMETTIPKIIETMHSDAVITEEIQEAAQISPAGAKSGDDCVFKYGDLSDCMSKYLNSSIDRPERERKRSLAEQSSEENENVNSFESDSLTLPKTLSLLTHDETSSEDIKNLLKQSFMEYSKSPSESLPIDSKIENDLETLLKMSAELLRDEYPIISSNTESSDVKDDLNATSVENNTVDLMSTTLSDLDSNDATESKRNSSYYDADMLQSEMESVSGDISATISSIKNTIKSIDSLCQDDDRRSRERTDRTLNDIIKVVEKLDEEKEIRSKSQESRTSDKPSVAISAIFDHASRDDEDNSSESNLTNPRYSVGSRMSRDRSRMTSPRRRKDDDFGEFESRVRRTKSPTSSVSGLLTNRYSGDFSSKYNLEKTSSSSESGSNAKLASPYKTVEKLEIRHTTVTSTFYDRYLCQKYEQQHKMDRSPSSPVINKAYLNSLKPTSSLTQSYHSAQSDYKQRRASRSNETSPANLPSGSTVSNQLRYDSVTLTSAAPKAGYLHLPQLSTSNAIHRSCDNILSNLSSTTGSTEFVQKSSYQSIKKSRDHTIDTDEILKRHSTAALNQSTSLSVTLPIKPKKPSELGIKLGLYKP